MSFTDDDLKRLKQDFPLISTDLLQALINRLEAAEKCVDLLAHSCADTASADCEGCKAWEAWRKAAGK